MAIVLPTPLQSIIQNRGNLGPLPICVATNREHSADIECSVPTDPIVWVKLSSIWRIVANKEW